MAITQEVDKLLTASFIMEVLYLIWLANVVMVKKSNDKWLMCVDFTDFNKVCSKDSYPLLGIDCMVYATTSFEFLSSVDSNPGYHQILMHPKDEEKIAFITEFGTCRIRHRGDLKNNLQKRTGFWHLVL